MTRLFVNVDHVATVREARKIDYPDPVASALIAEGAGAHGITAHLREDRRHVNDDDVRRLRAQCKTPFNFELSVAEEIVALCESLIPAQATLVPEKREEVTTEGGLDMKRGFDRIAEVTRRLTARGIVVSLFTDPDEASLEASVRAGATHVELHTGTYANARDHDGHSRELDRLASACERGQALGLIINAGHGLHYGNTAPIAALEGLNDLNIGHAIVGRAIEIGMAEAVTTMLEVLRAASTDA